MRRERGILGIRSVIEVGAEGERELRARQLESKGLVTIREESFVRCVHWGDTDIVDVWDRGCTGRVHVDSHGHGGEELEEATDEVPCPRCGRELRPDEKQRFTSLVVRRNDDGVRELARRRIAKLGLGFREWPKGMFRIEGEVRDVRVYMVDLCPERACTAPRDEAVVLIRCDEQMLLPRLPDVPTFALEDLALADDPSFEETLRAMAFEPLRYAVFPAAEERKREETPPPAPRAQGEGGEAPVALAVTEDGERALTLSEYERLRATAAANDLLIDMTAPASGRRVSAGFKAADGEFVQTTLSASEAALLCELIRVRRAVRPAQLKTLEGVTKERMGKRVEEARAKVDYRVGATWRAFKTVAGGGEGATQYKFEPPRGFRFAVVVPVGDAA